METYSNRIQNQKTLIFTCKKCEDAKNYIDKNASSDLTLSEIAKAVDFSIFHLSRKFKNIMGISISKYIIYRRIELAKELLRTTNMQITKICATVGYNSLSYFSELFKKSVGVSPIKFRAIKIGFDNLKDDSDIKAKVSFSSMDKTKWK